MKNKKIIVFGANGFLGIHLCNALKKKKYDVLALLRSKDSKNIDLLIEKGVKIDFVGNLFNKKKFKKKYSDVAVIINLAGLAHINLKKIKVLNKNLNEFNNIEKNIVSNFNNNKIRIIHLSTAKVKDNDNDLIARNQSSYEIVKVESEKIIRNFYKNHIILRPPLLYGPYVKANFLSLMKLIDNNIPLPFKNLNNRRSYMYVENLIDAILFIIKKNYFCGKTYSISDHQTLSTNKLIKLLAKNLSKQNRLFYIPPTIIKFIFKKIGKVEIFNKIMGNFVIDNSKFINDTKWKPPYNNNEGIKKTCFWYKRRFKI